MGGEEEKEFIRNLFMCEAIPIARENEGWGKRWEREEEEGWRGGEKGGGNRADLTFAVSGLDETAQLSAMCCLTDESISLSDSEHEC